MKYKTEKDIQNALDASLKNLDSDLLNAKMLMFRFLGEIEKITEDRNITRRGLAELVGTSPSYITQLYRGNKVISLDLLSKMQRALEIKFLINTVSEHHDFSENDIFTYQHLQPRVSKIRLSRNISIHESKEYSSPAQPNEYKPQFKIVA